jgi:hypothetical protein
LPRPDIYHPKREWLLRPLLNLRSRVVPAVITPLLQFGKQKIQISNWRVQNEFISSRTRPSNTRTRINEPVPRSPELSSLQSNSS